MADALDFAQHHSNEDDALELYTGVIGYLHDHLNYYHIYNEKTLHDRFHWEGKGMPTGSIHLAFVRIYELPTPLSFPYSKAHAGCRSWIDIPEHSTEDIRPVIDEQAFSKINSVLSELAT